MATLHTTATPEQKQDHLVGRRFGHWVVLEFAGWAKPRNRCYSVRCDCGTTKIIARGSLATGASQSCGCQKSAAIARKVASHGDARSGRKTPEYLAWQGMIRRCYDTKEDNYPRYGGAGVRVCDEWRRDFPAFLEHIGRMPTPGLTVDRIEGTRGYEPGNVRWATIVEQNRNRSSVFDITASGETHCAAEWAPILGMKYDALYKRICRGTAAKAFADRGWTLESIRKHGEGG